MASSNFQKVDTVTGSGNEAKPGRVVRVHYTGWLYDAAKPDKRGDKFDSSKDSGEPFDFTLGGRQVIPGWDEGVAGMKVGEHAHPRRSAAHGLRRARRRRGDPAECDAGV